MFKQVMVYHLKIETYSELFDIQVRRSSCIHSYTVLLT